MNFLVALRKELLHQWRSYRLLIVTVVLIAFGLLSPLFAKLTPELMKLLPGDAGITLILPEPTTADAVGQYTKNIGQFGVILALLMTMGAVAQEKDKGTAAMILAKPMSRGAFLGAKFVALGLVFLAGIAVAGAGAYYYTLILFEAMDLALWLAMNGLMLLFTLVYVALTLLCSTVSKSQVVAGGLAFGLVIILVSLGAIPQVGRYLPGQLITWGAELLITGQGAAWPALWVSLGIIAAAIVGAWILFEQQEL